MLKEHEESLLIASWWRQVIDKRFSGSPNILGGYYAGKSIESAFHRLIIFYSPMPVIDHGSLGDMLEKENCL